MKLYKTRSATLCLEGDIARSLGDFDWDQLFAADNPEAYVEESARGGLEVDISTLAGEDYFAPIGNQEIWAAGVTYFKSRDARIAESEKAGGGTFYDRVYDADRPELFYKGSKRTVVGQGQLIRIRSDSRWNVPEPELTLAISKSGNIFGYTVGNDVSSRDIEGENPLYLPQAKVYDGSCALGPCLFVSKQLDPSTEIELSITRNGESVFEGVTKISEIKRSFDDLSGFLYRNNSFPVGAYLMTGTGIVPPDGFSLASGDRVSIGILPIGTLANSVE